MLTSSTEFELAESLGLNAVRLGFMWSGYNPAPGVFNATYMSVIKTIIGKFNDHGIHVLLDMHQVRSRTATRRARSRLSARRAASVCAHKPRMVLCVMYAACCVLNPFRAPRFRTPTAFETQDGLSSKFCLYGECVHRPPALLVSFGSGVRLSACVCVCVCASPLWVSEHSFSATSWDGGADGAPLWVVNKSTARKAFPWPLTDTCSRDWEKNFLAEAVAQCYQDLYVNPSDVLWPRRAAP
jgi:hypothetical protein